MSDTSVSKQEFGDALRELSAAAVTRLQDIFPSPPGGLTWEEISRGFARGESIKDMCGIADAYMERTFEEGLSKLDSAEYDEAWKIFSTLALYEPKDPRYWAALGKSLEAQELYADALQCYQMLTQVTGGGRPMPYLCMGYCHLELGDVDSAREVLELGREICDPYDDEQREVIDLMEKLLESCA